jgi:hypothetical protein
MKIQGPGGPTRTPATTPVGDADRADASSGVDRSRETQPVAAIHAGASADPVAEVAAGLRAGSLTPRQAVDRLVESAVASMGAGLPDAARAELRGRLERLLAEDPYLTDKTRRIGVVPDED